MGYCDKIVSVGDFFGIELFVLKTGKERKAEATKLFREKNKEKMIETWKKYRESNQETIKKYREENKEKLRETSKKYREENKDKIKAKGKAYHDLNKEKIKEYREANKEKITKQRKKHREENIERLLEQSNTYRKNNLEKIKEYNQSPQGIKSRVIRRWKFSGVLHDNFDELYTIYLNCTNCMVCDKKFKNTRDRHLDHSHETGLYRNVLCCSCNNRDYWKKVLKNKETK